VFGPMAIAMGAIRYKALKFLIMCVAGNLVKALVVSYIGFLGLAFIQKLFAS
jgi:membrane protein DedA with SNARE-associated domain